MDFRILGPLEVDEAGRTVPIVGRRQRALLAILLVHANKPVSTDRLIEELWGERPPATVKKGLQVLVSGLRKALGEGSARLATQRNGYLLHVEPGELDLDRCERLGRQGREALASGDCRPAAEQLREALDLWRGPPLAEFAFESFAQAEIGRLEELRLALLEDRIDADLACGTHATLVGELEALVAEHPLRERVGSWSWRSIAAAVRLKPSRRTAKRAQLSTKSSASSPRRRSGNSSTRSSPMTRGCELQRRPALRSAACRCRQHPPLGATTIAAPSRSCFNRTTTAS